MTPKAGKDPSVITYLEMTEQPTYPPPVPAAKLALLRAERPPVPFYRFLYEQIGRRWQWTERLQMDDEALAAVIHDENVEIYVLYAGGAPAGFSELDRRQSPDIELAYFGLMAEFTGRAFGAHFLRWTVNQAWTPSARKALGAGTERERPPHPIPLQTKRFRRLRPEDGRVRGPSATGFDLGIAWCVRVAGC